MLKGLLVVLLILIVYSTRGQSGLISNNGSKWGGWRPPVPPPPMPTLPYLSTFYFVTYTTTTASYSSCSSGPCKNNATCTSNWWGGYKCNCSQGFTGVNCDTCLNPCNQTYLSPCQNGGNCTPIYNLTSQLQLVCGLYTCSCPAGYTGKNCEILVNPCSSNPCLNQGVCSPFASNTTSNFTCVCLPGSTGPLCQYFVDPCSSSPCLFNGNCITVTNTTWINSTTTNGAASLYRVPGQFRCVCAPNWLGPRCEYPLSPCYITTNANSLPPCGNNGICRMVTNNTFITISSGGNTALFPSTNTTYLIRGEFSCDCLGNYAGRYCELQITSRPPWWWWFWP